MSKTVQQRVLTYLQQMAPQKATNSDIAYNLRLKNHQQAFSATRTLFQAKAIQGRRLDNDWEFWVETTPSQVVELPRIEVAAVQEESLAIATEPIAIIEPPSESMTSHRFEIRAQKVMSKHYGTALQKGKLPGIHKIFDFVSTDGHVVGDAKYYALVGGERLPPAKFSVIAEHVWLLEKTSAQYRFLVFGNDSRVPEQWLERYRNLVAGIEFFFLDDTGELHRLPT